MDIEHIRSLVQLMVDNDLSRIEIQEGETHILLRRGADAHALAAGHPAVSAPPSPPPAAAAVPAVTDAPAQAPADSGEVFVRSPMVGTFYSAPDPDSPPFVKPGDGVDPETVVCLVEAMKVFNEIKADVSGRVARMLVQNGDAVEYDQPLFAIVPA